MSPASYFAHCPLLSKYSPSRSSMVFFFRLPRMFRDIIVGKLPLFSTSRFPSQVLAPCPTWGYTAALWCTPNSVTILSYLPNHLAQPHNSGVSTGELPTRLSLTSISFAALLWCLSICRTFRLTEDPEMRSADQGAAPRRVRDLSIYKTRGWLSHELTLLPACAGSAVLISSFSSVFQLTCVYRRS